MGFKSIFLIFLLLGVISAGLLCYFCPQLHTDLEPPQLPDEYFGKGIVPKSPSQFPKDDTTINKFTINVDETVLQDLKQRLANTRFVEPLDNVEFQYGFHATQLKKVVDYWRTQFDWRKQEKLLNKFSHFTTQIEGLKVHFIHEKPDLKGRKVRVLPLLLLHGWPGSIAEFTKILPLLTTPQPNRDYVFEVICPSIPGYGFSEAPHQPGFNVAAASRMFSKLMSRLGIQSFYIQGGDWGAAIASTMSKAYADRVLGVHLNLFSGHAFSPVGLLKYAVGYFFPSYFMSEEEYKDIYPFTKKLYFALQEGGYFHIQATKPDTIGAALIDSPAGLAAYILEKFSTAGGLENRDLPDGGLTKIFTLDELLTNVMIYWTTSTSASSVRFYKENMMEKYRNYKFENMPIKVPSGIAAFPREIVNYPRSFLTCHLRNLVRYQRLPRGGHFAAMEEPQLLADEIWNFIADVEKSNADKTNAEKETAEKRNTEKGTAEKSNTVKRNAEKDNTEKRTAEKVNAEKRTAEKVNAEKRTAEKINAEKRTAEKVNAEKRTAEKANAEKRTAEKTNTEKRTADNTKKNTAEKNNAEKSNTDKRKTKS